MKKIIALIVLLALPLSAQNKNRQAWKGNAILGNGNVCLVYSDDSRIAARSKSSGIQHYYFGDYAMDYISGSSFSLIPANGTMVTSSALDNISLSPFFKTVTRRLYSGKLKAEVSCYVHPGDVTVLEYKTGSGRFILNAEIDLRKAFVSDKITGLTSLKIEKKIALASWGNGVVLAFASPNPLSALTVSDSSIKMEVKVNGSDKTDLLIAPGRSAKEAIEKINKLKKTKYARQADAFWNKWIEKSLPAKYEADSSVSALPDAYRKTMYSVKAATINGQIPADMTGQFVTNNMPQLYPRDAMKTARVFLLAGYYEEARSIIEFWCRNNIPKKSKGEYYARYDAAAKPVDGGSGARFDEPEWDANGYLIQLLNWYHQKTGQWLAKKDFVYELADFLVSKIDSTGLLYEGGIVEWTGYLPTTNMVCSAGLATASSIAKESGDSALAKTYSAASKTISENLFKTYDLMRSTYAAVRFHGVKDGNTSIADQQGEKVFLWDGTMQFGYLWGYPLHPMLESTIKFYEENLIAKPGGMQYFEAMDNGGLSAYGGDMFLFTTASLAQYYSLVSSNNPKALKLITWMMKNSNTYGLMPERIYLNESDCSDASPLSWCNAEFAAAVYCFLGFHGEK